MNKTNLFTIMILLFGVMTTLAQDGNGDGRVWVWESELKDAIGDAKIYTSPKDRTYFVRPNFEEWLFRAVSKSAREEWRATTMMDAAERTKIYTLLDELAALAKQKLAVHVPGMEQFKFGTDEEKKLMMTTINGPEQVKVHHIGLQDQNWRIEKNDDGIPTGRRKWGYIWYKKDPKLVDYPWCRVFEVYLYQPYTGGGTYGATEAYFERRWLAGCPK